MKNLLKKRMAKIMTVVMVLSTMFTTSLFINNNNVNAADLPLQIDFNTKYSGEIDAIYDSDANAWFIQFFNVNDSAVEAGEMYFVSFEISGASSFQQLAVQSSVNNWDWGNAPKVWKDNGVEDGTFISGIFEVTKDDDNLAFKMHLDHELDELDDLVTIEITDLYIVKVDDGKKAAIELPESLQLDFGQKYFGTVKAVNDGTGVYETEFFNLNDSNYSEGDTFAIFFKVSEVDFFKQVAVQNSVFEWDWDKSPKLWQNGGLPDGQVISGGYIAVVAGGNQSFKIRFDSIVSGTLPDEVMVTLTDLIVVKIGDYLTLPSSKAIDLNKWYTGDVIAEPDEYENHQIGFFNVNTSYKTGDTFRISFEDISDATMFQQINLQTSADDWAYDEDRNIWVEEGISGECSFVVTATKDSEEGEKLAFKFWLDELTDPDLEFDEIPMRLTNLNVTKVEIEDVK